MEGRGARRRRRAEAAGGGGGGGRFCRGVLRGECAPRQRAAAAQTISTSGDMQPKARADCFEPTPGDAKYTPHCRVYKGNN